MRCPRMSSGEPFVTYLELRESTPEGEQASGLSHNSAGLVLLHVLELAAADIAAQGSAIVAVANPAPGGGAAGRGDSRAWAGIFPRPADTRRVRAR